MTDAPKLMMVAGEPSGDLLGAAVMRSITKRSPDATFVGIGGPGMTGEGLSSVVPFDDLSVMGLAEVLPRVPRLLRHLKATAQVALQERPDALLTIDSPGFSFRLARRLRGASFAKVHFVAPSVWAWRPGRAKAIAPLYDHLLTLLPFEPPYFERVGLAATFVGHPAIERVLEGRGERFRTRHGLTTEEPILLVLPGSRRSETNRLLPVFGETLRNVFRRYNDLRVVVATVPGVAQKTQRAAATWPGNPIIATEEVERLDAFAAGSFALAASGTVALELAIAGVPMVVAYDVNPVTAMIARRLVKTPFVNLVNIILQHAVVPEMILEHCRPGPLSAEVEKLIVDPERREAQRAAFRQAVAQLKGPATSPSDAAAETILKVAGVTSQPAVVANS